MYYAFNDSTMNQKLVTTNLSSALLHSKDEKLVFKRVKGSIDIWALHPVRNGKVLKYIILQNGKHKTFTTEEQWIADRDFRVNKIRVQLKMDKIFNEGKVNA